MLWYKAWLETRWRFVFVLVVTVMPMIGFVFLGASQKVFWQGIRLIAPLMSCFAALYLAGAGVNTQTVYSAVTGFHGSMLFTLSLPVTRMRLLYVRAATGALETCVFVLLAEATMLYWCPQTPSVPQALLYAIRAIVCAMAVYAFSTFLACILDEMWQFTGSVFILGAAWLIVLKLAPLSEVNLFRAMDLGATPLTAPLPWISLLTSIVLASLFLGASVLVLRRKEY